MNIRNLFYNTVMRHELYVIADPADNSITLSKWLFRHMRATELGKAKVYVFRLNSAKPAYAFAVNPDLKQATQLADIQYNAKHRCIGFETLCPTVNRIFYDYRLPHNRKCKLYVAIKQAPGVTYYQISNS